MPAIPLAIIAAIDDEIRIIKSRMAVDSRVHVRPSLFMLGSYDGTPLILARSGMGGDVMRRATEYLTEHYSPGFCLHVGYCGGTDPRYGPGDLVVASAVTDAASGRTISMERELVERAIKLCKDRMIRSREGRIVTVAAPVHSPHEKAFIGTQHDAQVLDVESFPFAEVVDSKGIPKLVVRAVFDPLDVALPRVDSAIDESGVTDGVAFAGHIVRNPKDILKIPRLHYFAMQARQSITAFVEAWLEGAR